MSVTSHLKDLLTKMGGTPKNGDSTSVLIDKIEDVYDGSGSSDTLLGAIFPIKLTCEKISDTVLTVSGGKTGPTEENFILANLKLDKTANEIYNAICSGSKILLYFDGPVFNNSFYRSNLSIMMNSLPIMIPKVNISTLLNYYDGTDAQVPFSLATEQFIQQYLATPFDAEHRADIRDKYVSNIEINKFVVDGMVPSMGVSVEEAAHNPSIPSNIILNDDTIDILFLIGDQPLDFMSNGIDDYPVSIIPLPCTV